MHKSGSVLVLAVVLALMVGVLAVAGCGGGTTGTGTSTGTATETPTTPALKTIEPGKLLIGSDTTFPPMEFIKSGNKVEGFDVDMMDAIGKKLGLTPEFKSFTFDAIIPAIKAGGKFDLGVSAFSITEARKKEINFSDPYFDSNQSIAMRVGGVYTDPSSLKGKKVGVQSGTTGQKWATENLKPAGAILVPYKAVTDAFAALQAKSVDAVINDLPVTQDIVSDPARGLEIVKQVATGEQYGIVVSKDNPDLLAAINKALAEIKADGTLDQIYKKWFPEE